MVRAYCETCDWSYELDDDEDRAVLDRAMIEHHAETGHPVVASDVPEHLAGERSGADRRERTPEN